MSETSTARRLLEFSRLFASGDSAGALEIIDALATDNPNEGPIHWQRARTLERLERYEDARAAVKRVLELRREFAPAWVLRAELGEEQGDYDPEPDLRRAVELDPRLGRARYALALLMHAEGKEEEAQALMDLAIELDSTLHEAFAARGGWSRVAAYVDPADAGARINRSHLERALSDFDSAIAIKPLSSYRFARADILRALERHEEAIAELDALIAEVSESHPLRALAQDARSRCEQALADRPEAPGEEPEEEPGEEGRQHLIGRLATMLGGLRQRK